MSSCVMREARTDAMLGDRDADGDRDGVLGGLVAQREVMSTVVPVVGHYYPSLGRCSLGTYSAIESAPFIEGSSATLSLLSLFRSCKRTHDRAHEQTATLMRDREAPNTFFGTENLILSPARASTERFLHMRKKQNIRLTSKRIDTSF